jgi:hypothetical protein
MDFLGNLPPRSFYRSISSFFRLLSIAMLALESIIAVSVDRGAEPGGVCWAQ